MGRARELCNIAWKGCDWVEPLMGRAHLNGSGIIFLIHRWHYVHRPQCSAQYTPPRTVACSLGNKLIYRFLLEDSFLTVDNYHVD